MQYQQALDILASLGPELRTGKALPAGTERRKFSLDHIRLLLGELGRPQERFRSVLIAGTNGKGSTAATLASICAAAGLRTGLYTSPHLARVNERMVVGGEEIADADFGRLFGQVHDRQLGQLHRRHLARRAQHVVLALLHPRVDEPREGVGDAARVGDAGLPSLRGRRIASY